MKNPTSEQQSPINWEIFKDFDPVFSEQIVKNVLSLLNDIYFRISYVDFDETIPRNNPDAPVILVSNHSGRAIPWDAICFMSGLLEQFDYDYKKVCKTLIAPVLSSIGVMVPFFVTGFWKKCGGVDATFNNFESLMQASESNVMLFPEGIDGIGKGFDHKYQLQQFSTSFIHMSLKYDTDIVPFSTVNAEYINPFMYNIPFINRIVKFVTGIPFLPLGLLTIILLIQPWFYYFAFPAQITFVKGQRIKRSDLSDKAYEEISKEEIEQIRDNVQLKMQQELDEAVDEYGKRPYDWKGFFKTSWERRKQFPYFLPFFWAFLFSEFQVQWEKGKEVNIKYTWRTMLKLFWKRPLVITYFIPIIGWLPILYWSYLGKHKSPKN